MPPNPKKVNGVDTQLLVVRLPSVLVEENAGHMDPGVGLKLVDLMEDVGHTAITVPAANLSVPDTLDTLVQNEDL